MSNLESKLREIVRDIWDLGRGKKITDDEAIAQIKEAFKAEGYSQIQAVGYRPSGVGYFERFPKLLSGKEWYDRFEKEAEALSYLERGGDGVVYVTKDNVLEAAKKASGLNS